MNTIIRVQKNRQNPYVMIRNALFEDPAMSWKAKGLLGYILSRPDDWQIHVRDLAHRSTDGRDSVYAALRELKTRGYIQETVQRHARGYIVAREYVVFEEPQLDPENPDQVPNALDPAKPDQAGLDREKPDQVQRPERRTELAIANAKIAPTNTDLTNTDKDQDLKDLADPSTPSESPDLTAKPCDSPTEVGPVDTEARDGETDALKSERPNPAPPSAGRRSSPDAKQLANRLKQRLQERGVTVFPRDWHLKAQASAQHLLATLSMAEAEALMDWALAHPFWGTKITDWYRIVALAPEWQQARHPGKGGPTHGPNRLPTSLAAGRHDDQGSLDALIQGP